LGRKCEGKRIHNGTEKHRGRGIIEEMGKATKVQGRRKKGRDTYT
jgi:hypothetical protein